MAENIGVKGLPPPRLKGREAEAALLERIMALATPILNTEVTKLNEALVAAHEELSGLKLRAKAAVEALTQASTEDADGKRRLNVVSMCLKAARNDMMVGPYKTACDPAVAGISELSGASLAEVERNIKQLMDKQL